MTLCVNEDGTIMRAASRLVDAVELLKPDRKESNYQARVEACVELHDIWLNCDYFPMMTVRRLMRERKAYTDGITKWFMIDGEPILFTYDSLCDFIDRVCLVVDECSNAGVVTMPITMRYDNGFTKRLQDMKARITCAQEG